MDRKLHQYLSKLKLTSLSDESIWTTESDLHEFLEAYDVNY